MYNRPTCTTDERIAKFMKSIDVDDDLYLFIASQTRHIGESASEILRRLLGLTHSTATATMVPSVVTKPLAPAVPNAFRGDLLELLNSGSLAKEELSVNRFLIVLSTLWQESPEAFATAAVKGRKRVYIALDSETLLANGKTTKPKPIPNTPYWVITNTNTKRKQIIIAMLMHSMGYDEALIDRICAVI